MTLVLVASVLTCWLLVSLMVIGLCASAARGDAELVAVRTGAEELDVRRRLAA